MSRDQVRRNREWIRALKAAGRCADCGKTTDRCGGADQMQFVRRESNGTGQPIGTMVSQGRTRTTIERALAECDLVCTEHAIARSRRRGQVA